MIRKLTLLSFLLVLLMLSGQSYGQDTLKVMSYNLLNFPNGRNDCGSNLSVPARWDTLRKIVQYQKPDVLMVIELQTEAGADSILNQSLNVGGITYYARANFVLNQSGYTGLNNMFFYNTQKVILHSQSEILTDLRDIGEYVVYANDPNLSTYNDTNFIRFYVGHLKAGNFNAPIEENRRASECTDLRTYIDGISSTGNFIFGGDFNFYTSNESGYQILTTGGVNKLNDPINRPGNWNNNSSFTDIHTQSTRSSQSIECGALGGTDDRFDFILISDSVVNGGDKVQYLSGTYAALGNDGNRFNQSLNNPPNTSLPDSIINALYYMSDHLPVVMDLLITYPNVMVLSTVQTEVTCNGDCNGTATATVAGGSPPYTYQWDDPVLQTTFTASGLCAGTYRFTFTDSTGAALIDSVVITDPPLLSALFSDSSIISCNGDSSGFATVSASGGVPAYTYLWNDLAAQTTATATGLPAGTYTVVTSDGLTCSDPASITITQIASTPLNVSITASINILCNGTATGSATISTSGGTTPYTFIWNDPSAQTDSIASNLPAGTYMALVTDSVGCPGADTITISQPTAMTFTVVDTGSATCDTANSQASVTVTGGTAPYTYLWNDSLLQTTSTADSLASGSYTIIITDQNGCIDSTYATISDATAPTLILTDSTEVICNGSATGSATVTPVGGTAPYTYSWSPGLSTDSTAKFLTAGTYFSSVTDSNGCQVVIPVTITEPPLFTASLTDSSNALCNGDSNGTATITPVGGVQPYTYLWSNGDTDSIATIPPGIYTVMVTDANGCMANDTVIPTACFEIESILVEACKQTGEPEGYNEMVKFHVGYSSLNTSDIVVNWPNNAWKGICQDSLTANTVDSINSTITAGGQVIEPSGGILPAGAQVILISSIYFDWMSHDWSGLDYTLYLIFQCDSNKNGHFKNYCSTPCGVRTLEMSIGINCGDTITYEPGLLLNGGIGGNGDGVEFDPAGNQTYINSGCLPPYFSQFLPPSVTITEPTPLSAVLTDSLDILCKGELTGYATAGSSGGTAPYTYSWNDPSSQSDSVATGLLAGNYIVSVTDNNGCTDTASVTLTEPSTALSSSIVSSLNIVCYGASTGSATVAALGGTSPYTYLWNDPSSQTNTIATSLTAGSYSVLVTDASGCQDSVSITLTEPSLFTIFTVDLVDAHCGQSDGSAIVNSIGGTLPHSYQWNDPSAQTDTMATGLSAGSYSVVFTDALGCNDSLTLVLNDIPGPGINGVTSTVAACIGDSTGTAAVDAGGGSAPYTYLWNDANAQTDSFATGLPMGNYSVTVTDYFGCQVVGNTVVSVIPPLVLSATSTPANCGLTDGTTNVVVTGGTSPYSYAWNSSPIQTNTTATGLGFGTYTIVVTDSNNCQDSTNVGVSNLGGPTVVVIDSTEITCNGDSTGSATIAASGGSTPYTYLWDDINAQTDSMATGLPAGLYNVNVTDAGGCGTVASVNIIEPSALVLSFSSTVATCGDTIGTANVSVIGGIPPYSYVWNDPGGQTDSTATGLFSGVFTVTVTDDSGCMVIDSATVTQTNALAVNTSAVNVLCNGNASGTTMVSTVGGTPPFTYSWNDPNLQTTANATSLLAGMYVVLVVDSVGCTALDSASVYEPNALQLIMSATDISCNAACDGSGLASVNGGIQPYTYSWNTLPGQTDSVATGLCSNVYQVSITDSNNCTVNDSVSITEPTVLAITISSTDVTCNGGLDGNVVANVTGGIAPYTYTWAGGSPPTPPNIGAGTYAVTVTDGNGCAVSGTTTVSEPSSAVSATLTSTPSLCNNLVGTASANTSGGSPPYVYIWDDPGSQTNGTATGLGTGTYNVTIADLNSCSILESIVVAGEQGPTIDSIQAINESCPGEGNGSATVYLTGGQAPFVYLWSDPNFTTTSSISALQPGTYSVLVTDSQGCIVTDSTVIATGTSCFNVPSSFTPNGDLTNDTWIIRGIQNYPNNTVEIYNRWGSLLFSSKGYAEPWDGTYEGQEVASATYYYIIILSDTEDALTGSVTVVR